MSKQTSRFKDFDFGLMFWKPFAESSPGRWDEIAVRFLDGTFEQAATRPNKAVDCPFPENHGSSKGVKKMRTKSDFSRSGNFLCSCHSNNCISVLEAMVATGVSRTKYDAACAITVAFGFTNVRTPTKAHSPKTITPVERAHYENVRKQKLATMEANKRKEEGNHKDYLKHVWSNQLSTDVTRAATLYIKRRSLDVNLLTSDKQKDVRFGKLTFIRPENGQRFETDAMATLLRCQKTLTPVAIQRTFFNESGVPLKELGESIYKKCTKILGDTWPVLTVVRCPQPEDTILHVGEGFETIAAVGSVVDSGGVVSTMNDDGLAKFTVPDLWAKQIQTIVIWADHDEDSQAGINAALEAAQRLQFEGYKVYIYLPDRAESTDWQDLISAEKLVFLTPKQRKRALVNNAVKAIFEPIIAQDIEVNETQNTANPKQAVA